MDPISVLMVDDNATFLNVLDRFLREYYPHEIAIDGTAHSGQEALRLVETLEPQLILLDLALPDMSGLEATPKLRAILPEALIIILTWYQNRGYKQAALQAGADAFVGKANLSSELLPRIRTLVSQAQLSNK